MLAATLFWGAPGLLAAGSSASLETARSLNEAFVEVAEKVSPAVVVVEVAHRPDYTAHEDSDNPLLDTVPPDLRRRWDEHSKKQRQEQSNRGTPIYDARGSGLVIREDGWILTNDHVVEGAEKVRIRLRDGKTYDANGQWFTDPQSDLAVVKIPATGLAVAKMGDASKTRVGEFAIAIGAPFDLDYSVTFGHISAKARSHVIPGWMGNSPGAAMDQDFLQTDASINPGNSGGPLVNIEGEVIGINTLIRGLNRGIGFAIPSNLAAQVAEHLINDGKYTRAWLGIQISALSDELEVRELLTGVNEGVVVRRILPEGPASKSGLQPADVITAVEGKAVATAQQLRNEVRARAVGTPIKLDVVRFDKEGKLKTVQLSLRTEPWPDETTRVVRQSGPRETPGSVGVGLKVQTLNKQLAEKFGVQLVKGVVVTDVERDSLAAQQRFHVGDVITEINRKPVATAAEFNDALRGGASKPLLVHLVSAGAPEFRILKDSGD
jgi:serine protease Do